jgi:hypothetical protein
MQKVIIATALLATASGKGMTHTKQVHKSMAAERKAARKSTMSALKSATPSEKKAHSMSVAASLEKEGVVRTKSHMRNRFFEIASTDAADCMSGFGAVDGIEAGRCTNGIEYMDESGMAYTFSEMAYIPNNGGFPIFASFWGHGCDWDNLLYRFRMPKTEFGFPGSYTVGGCLPVYPDGAGTSSAPMYHRGAGWHEYRHMPDYNAVMEGVEGDSRDCEDDIYSFYSFINADVCMAEDEDDGTSYFRKFNVMDCHDMEGNTRSVTEMRFSDAACTTTIDSEMHYPEHCVFDVEYFTEEMEYEGYAYLEYETRDCYKAAASP